MIGPRIHYYPTVITHIIEISTKNRSKNIV